jgi:PEGA domain-containing protein
MMKTPPQKLKILNPGLFLCSLLFFTSILYARNDILGEIKLVGPTKVERTSGVWVDGLYLGYLDELKGSKKVLLLPGKHEIVTRQSGYKDFSQEVIVEPGQKDVIRVSMEKDPQAQYPKVTAEVKISVRPRRAAVFVDDMFVGHVDEFDGLGHAMLLSPGEHQIRITLPGYQAFETEIRLLPHQKFRLKTDLLEASITQAGLLK